MPLPRQIVAIINAATVYYLSAIAVAIGFRMNLFNIGVDGQYRVAAFAAAVFAGQAWLPGPLNIAVSLLVAMAAGGLWAGIAGILKVTRGVSEVISTIMLNAIATFLVSFLLLEGGVARRGQQRGQHSADPGVVARPRHLRGRDHCDAEPHLRLHRPGRRRRPGLLVRAGQDPVRVRPADDRAVRDRRRRERRQGQADGAHLDGHLRSGRRPGRDAAALRQDYTYGDTFQSGLGFAGIAIALLGRNNAIGIVFAALLWAYLDAQGNGLQINAGVSDRLVWSSRASSSSRSSSPTSSSAGRGPDGAAAGRLAARGRSNAVARDGRGRGMSDQGLVITTGLETPPPPRRPIHRARWFWFAVIGGAIVVLSTVRVITGAEDIDSSGALTAAIALAMPIGLAGLGGLWSERAGVVNIGLEGMMILGTWGGAFFAYYYGPWVGILGAILLGIVGGAVHALATVIFGVDHIVSGVAINLLGAGAGAYLAVRTFSSLPGGGPTQSPPLPQLPFISIPWLSDWLGQIEETGWWLVSDIAGVLRALTTNLNVLSIIAVLLLILSWWILWHTPFGLRLRSCGEAPHAAETLGVNVIRYKFMAVLISGGLAGLAGGFLVLVASNLYREGQVPAEGTSALPR